MAEQVRNENGKGSELEQLFLRYELGEELEPRDLAVLQHWVVEEVLGGRTRRDPAFPGLIICTDHGCETF